MVALKRAVGMGGGRGSIRFASSDRLHVGHGLGEGLLTQLQVALGLRQLPDVSARLSSTRLAHVPIDPLAQDVHALLGLGNLVEAALHVPLGPEAVDATLAIRQDQGTGAALLGLQLDIGLLLGLGSILTDNRDDGLDLRLDSAVGSAVVDHGEVFFFFGSQSAAVEHGELFVTQ